MNSGKKGSALSSSCGLCQGGPGEGLAGGQKEEGAVISDCNFLGCHSADRVRSSFCHHQSRYNVFPPPENEGTSSSRRYLSRNELMP